ncbi:vanadium-dependent haloperoxidase [uncultured Draconibacterium sp.]|uniref:vanadium-dependent haloperoxidase n=1 Tax=uncultured Draconibacterium sp. TaxID=1573823 RepID=UPI00321696AE
MMSFEKKWWLLSLIFVVLSCSKQKEPLVVDTDDFHKSVDQLTSIMIHDIFSPPVASRVYVYPIVTAYEILQQKNSNYNSLLGQLNDFPEIPAKPDVENLNLEVSALVAFMDVGKRLIFSEDKMESYRDSLYSVWGQQNSSEFEVSRDYGLQVAAKIVSWIDADHYNETRTMPKFTVNLNEKWRWQPTPPDYMNGIEPHWEHIRTLTLDSAAQFKPVPHPEFSLEEGSKFYSELLEVYEVGLKEQQNGDASNEVQIARFWDCNPYVSVHRGHMMFAVKKITPGAHWIGICKIASKKAGLNLMETLAAYTSASVSIFDAFISCWEEKYSSVLIRPENLINKYIDENWLPILQTPPFPEYTSGHSVVSGAASVALTHFFGDNFAFDDDTELPYGLPVRSFTSFYAASAEAAISRMYGGIHYRAAIENGLDQGLKLGEHVSKTVQTKAN